MPRYDNYNVNDDKNIDIKQILTELLKVRINKVKINRELKNIRIIQRKTPNRFKRFRMTTELDDPSPDIKTSSVILHNIRIKTTLGSDFYLQEDNRWYGYYEPTSFHYEADIEVYDNWDKREKLFMMHDHLIGFHYDENENLVYDFHQADTYNWPLCENFRNLKPKIFGVHYLNILKGTCSCKGFYYRGKCSHQNYAKKELSFMVEKLIMKKVFYSYFGKVLADDILLVYYGN